jgi:Niemann-Pick C1 protein
MRFTAVIVEADNVLEPLVIQTMYRARKLVTEIETELGDTLETMCQRVPVVRPSDVMDKFFKNKRRRRKREETDGEENFDDFSDFGNDEFFEDDFDDGFGDGSDSIGFAEMFSVDAYPDPYCGVVEGMPTSCFEMNIVELWANDGEFDADSEATIESLTLEDVIEKINGQNMSGLFLTERNYTELLSAVEHDSTGRIVSARATVMRWLGVMNATAAKLDGVPERDEPTAKDMFAFEGEMIKVLANASNYPDGVDGFVVTARSFGDIMSETILGDLGMFAIGYVIVFCYVLTNLGGFNCVDQRVYLSIAGIFSVVMGIGVSYGACAYMGLFFGPMHSVLPFLLLGIGIDDMFVIVQCYSTLTKSEKQLSLEERFGKTMEHAGVAITITSFTDVIAFGIGGTTVLPALRSFCLYASVGIVAVYFFQCTFFLAWMTIDQKRIEAKVRDVSSKQR